VEKSNEKLRIRRRIWNFENNGKKPKLSKRNDKLTTY